MSAAVASRSSLQHPMLRGSRPGTPSWVNFGSPAISHLHQAKVEGTESPSRQTRAASDPPPSESAKRSSHFLRSAFELEPNPFEQSFSASSVRSSERSTAREAQEEPNAKPTRRARSQSPASGARTPAGGINNPRLPPVATITSPTVGLGGHDATGFGWNFDHSLRTGPLSPAMLHGPTPGAMSFGMSSYFDANNFRTGLTPSANGGISFPPQSPATAALFAMMTNAGQTPDTNGLTTGQNTLGIAAQAPRSEKDMPNHFDAGFRKAMEANVKPETTSGFPAIGLQHHPALMNAGGLQNFAVQNAPKPLNADQRAALNNNNNGMMFNGAGGPLPPPRLPYPATSSSAIPPAMLGGAPNPLFLLSQAGGQLNRNASNGDDDVLAATALSSLNSPHHVAETSPQTIPIPQPPAISAPIAAPPRPKRASTSQAAAQAQQAAAATAIQPAAGPGRKRKAAAAIMDEADIPPPATRGRKKGSTNKKTKVQQSEEHDSDDMHLDDGGNSPPAQKIGPNGKPIFETEEEKRKNFLERNRQAALKCRQRKKAWLASLQSKVELLTADNETLQSTVQALRDEITTLRSVLISHKDCPVFASSQAGMATLNSALAGDQSHLLPPPRQID